MPYTVAYRNLGTVSSEDAIRFIYDTSKLILDSASVPLISNSGNTLVWVDTVSAGYLGNKYFHNGYKYPYFLFSVKPSAVMGATLQCSATITSPTTNASASDNKIIRASYDPNSKEATPQLTTTQVANGNGIDYTIHFQNVGTDTAINIVITDSISSLLSTSVFQSVANPLNGLITIGSSYILIQFLNVNLVDSNVSQLNSNGFIKFKLRPQPSVAVGTTINNAASIKFDANGEIVTNTVTTLITDSTLPVRIISYQLKQIDGSKIQVENQWTTANEQNTGYYNVQRSIDGTYFTTIGKLVSKGNGANTYQFIDPSPPNGINYYRLQSVDKNGVSSFSKIVAIQLSSINYQSTLIRQGTLL